MKRVASVKRHAGVGPVLGVYDAACLVSLLGLLSAVAAIALASVDIFELALVALILAGIADLFDGVVARRLRRSDFAREYGVQLDTVVDVVAFVAAPVAIALHTVPLTWFGAICLAWFVLAGVVRLAHFNTLSIRGNAQQASHRGLPVTYTALIFPLLFLLHGTLAAEIFELGLAGAFALIGLLFIIDMPVPKPRGAFYILLPLVALLLTVYWSGRYLQWFVTA